MTTDNTKDAFETMQKVFTAASWPKMSDAATQQMQTFWKTQEKMLDSLHELSQSWFERRHKATQCAVDAARGMGEAKSPVDAFQHYQTWMMGSADRLMADGFACQKHLMNVVEAAAAHIPAEAAQMKTDVMATVSAMRDAQARAQAA